jgi:hypothetical protein
MLVATITDRVRGSLSNTPDHICFYIAISTLILIDGHTYFFAALFAGAALAARSASASARTDCLVSAEGSAIDVRRDKIPANTDTPPISAQSTFTTETS